MYPIEKIQKTLWSIRNLSPNTQRTYAKMLSWLLKYCDLDDPVGVERYVFGAKLRNKSRLNLFCAYKHYCDVNGVAWVKPRLREEPYHIKIPTKEKIDQIIDYASQKYATIYNISKHGLRPDEVGKITLRDIDHEQRQLTVRTSKLILNKGLINNIMKLRRLKHNILNHMHLLHQRIRSLLRL